MDPWLLLTVLLFWVYFFLLTLVFVYKQILIMWLLQFPLTFHQTKNGMLRFIAYFMTILVLIRMVFVIIWEMLWEDIFKFSTSAAAIEFCEWVQVWVDVYIHHRKYQVKPHSSPWFLADCAATIVHRNYFFRLYQQDKSSESKVQASSNCFKRVLEVVKLASANKRKVSITFEKLGTWDF